MGKVGKLPNLTNAGQLQPIRWVHFHPPQYSACQKKERTCKYHGVLRAAGSQLDISTRVITLPRTATCRTTAVCDL
jgi:hypothetical protein